MPRGIRDLRQAQIGFQADCASPAVPTARIVGNPGMKKLVNRVFPTDATGLMSSHIINRYYDPWILAEVPIETSEEGLTFQQFPWYLSMGAVGGIAPTGGPDYLWTFCPDLEDGDMPDLATIRYGDNAAVWESTCCFARELRISGAFQDSWKLEADIIGRDMQNSYYSAGAYHDKYFEDIAYPTPLETILGQMTSLYVDTTCEAPGDRTLVQGYLIDWAATLPGFHPKFYQDGVRYFTTMGLASRAMAFEATVEFDDVFTKDILWDGWVDGTPVYIALLAQGSALGADVYAAEIDMVLAIDQFETLDERDGNDIIKFSGRTVYDVACADADLAREWCIKVTTDTNVLP